MYLGTELLWPIGPQPQASVPGIEMDIENVGNLTEFDTEIIEGAYVDIIGGKIDLGIAQSGPPWFSSAISEFNYRASGLIDIGPTFGSQMHWPIRTGDTDQEDALAADMYFSALYSYNKVISYGVVGDAIAPVTITCDELYQGFKDSYPGVYFKMSPSDVTFFNIYLQAVKNLPGDNRLFLTLGNPQGMRSTYPAPDINRTWTFTLRSFNGVNRLTYLPAFPDTTSDLHMLDNIGVQDLTVDILTETNELDITFTCKSGVTAEDAVANFTEMEFQFVNQGDGREFDFGYIRKDELTVQGGQFRVTKPLTFADWNGFPIRDANVLSTTYLDLNVKFR